MSIQIGKTISHYQVLELLGQGGMGEVYLAEDTKLKRKVALKFLPQNFICYDDSKERFIQEAQVAAALNHPNICTIFEMNETEELLFIAMEFIDGQNLKEKIDEESIAPNDLIDIAIQISEGLQAAHTESIVHRDIKSTNIMVTSNGHVKIMDFGLAKLIGQVEKTETNSVMGTISYMSPEQARGEEIDHLSDIWSFGVVLYEILACQMPFQGEYDQVIIYSIMNEDHKPLSDFCSDIPSQMQKIVDKCLEKKCDDRYQNDKEILTDLKALKKTLETGTLEDVPIKQDPTIAVLPFLDMSPGKDQEYFCDGISEELIDSLAKVDGMRVVSRTSSFSFKGKELDVSTIGDKLKSNYIVEGSVRKAGNTLRITAQLVDVKDDYHIWSDKYDRELVDVFAIQDEIARTIVNTLKIKILSTQEDTIVKQHTNNIEAYNLYLLGRFHWHKVNIKGINESIKYYQQALEKESNFALAYFGIAESYWGLLQIGNYPPMEVIPNAKEAIINALKIDDTYAEIHAIFGHIKFLFDWDWSFAEEEFKKALELNPRSLKSYLWYASFLSSLLRHNEAIEIAQKAVDIDSSSLLCSVNMAARHFWARDYDKAIELCNLSFKAEPNFWMSHWILGLTYLKTEMLSESIRELCKATELLGGKGESLPALGFVYAISGKRIESEKILQRLENDSKDRYISPFYFAIINLGLNQKDVAFEWFEKAFHDRDQRLAWWLTSPLFDTIRSDPRYIKLLSRIGFPVDKIV